MWETNSLSEVVLTFVSGLVGFLRKVVTSVHGYDTRPSATFMFAQNGMYHRRTNKT